MAYWDSEFQRVRSPILRYGFAVVSVAIATAIALEIREYQFHDVALPVLVLVIGLVTWYAGTGPAVLAVLLTATAFNYLFVEPLYSFYVSTRDISYFLVFVLSALVVTSFSAVRRRIEENLRNARDRLQIELKSASSVTPKFASSIRSSRYARGNSQRPTRNSSRLPIPYRMTCERHFAISSATPNSCKSTHRVRWTIKVKNMYRRFSNQEKEWAT